MISHVPEGPPSAQRYLPCSFEEGGVMFERNTEACGYQPFFSASRTSASREWNIVLCTYLNENSINEQKGLFISSATN